MRGKKPRLYNSHRQCVPDSSAKRYTIRRGDTGQFYAGEDSGDVLWETSLDHAFGYDNIGSAITQKHALLRLGLPVYVAYDGERV